MKKTAIALCILSPITYVNAGAIDFLKESNHTFGLENFYDNVQSGRYDKTGNSDILNWVQSASYNFDSVYVDDHYGFNLGLLAVEPLDYGEVFFAKSIAQVDVDKNGKRSAQGFNKVSEAFLKQKFTTNDNLNINLYEGLRVLNKFGALSREGSVTSSAYYGITTEVNSEKWGIKAGYLTEYSSPNDSDTKELLTKDNKEIDFIYTVAVDYKNDGQSFKYYIGEGQDYLRSQSIGYSKKLTAKKVSANLIYVNSLSKYKAQSDRNRLFDNDAYIAEVKTDFFLSSGIFSLGYAYVSAKRDSSLGRFENHLSNNSQGDDSSLAKGLSKDFYNDQENVLLMSYFHRYSQEIRFGAIARYGFNFEYEGQDLYEYELGGAIFYTPKSVPGLQLSLKGGPNSSYRRARGSNTPYLDSNGKTNNFDGTTVMAKVSYNF
ncbi:hypothetical protein C0J08_05745 [Marinomonas sp. CT5]|uniref:hypothetical protein n=1 Tax=Marinomonas sp. CT5 TaxID=2066133 RepID=UPI001BAE9A40|nr:hypothetical protein [Marinomonas sp. CT5]QUX94944.1 hypothetical protein C0J08_05745 [Marinomonas sp. CT5]